MSQQEYDLPGNSSSGDMDTNNEVVSSQSDVPARRRGGLPFIINWPAMLVIVVLIALAIFGLFYNQGTLPAEVMLWWPVVILVPAAFWFLGALARRHSQGLLGSTTLFGIGLGLLLAQQGLLPTQAGIVGITLIAAGTGIMLRGLLLRNQPIG